jgi:omega-amidase
MHVSILQYDIVWEDKPASHARMDDMLEAHPPQPGGLLLTPELGDVGISCKIDRIADGASLEWATRTAQRFECFVQHGYAEQGDGTRGLNTAAIVDPKGNLLGRYTKVHPFSFGGETKYYQRGERLLMADLGGMQVCPMICYDLRFPELWRLARRAGAEVFTIGASWPSTRTAHWRALLVARAIENQAWVIACNRTGSDPHLSYDGSSMIVSPLGDILTEGGHEPTILQAELDPEMQKEWRNAMRCQDDAEDRFLGAIEIDRASSEQRG